MVRFGSVLVFAVFVLLGPAMSDGRFGCAWAETPPTPKAQDPTPKAQDTTPKAQDPTPKAPDKDDEYELQKVLVDTLDQVERNYVRGISRRELVEAAIDGILRKLDPYSAYIGPEELDEFRTSVESEFGGIGIQIANDGDELQVLSPLVGAPAYQAGILAGDRIVEIDGKSTEDVAMEEVVRRLKGPVGSKVVLTVIHPGKHGRETISVTRAQVHVETVLGDRRKSDDSWDFMLDRDRRIGYVRITAFSRDTASELRSAIESLEREKLAGLIVDLRFNPGGLLSSAIEVSDMFVAEGRIVSTEGRNAPERQWDARKEGTFPGFPMVVLVNRFSASASEIVAACLQDHKRAKIMGERTWGKGSVQNVVSLEQGHSALKLTTSSYHRPSGKNIHRFPDATENDEWGVTPDEGCKLELDPVEMVALVNQRRHRDVVKPKAVEPAEKSAAAGGADPRKSPDKVAEASPEKPVVDRVLTMAVDYLGVELAKAK
jgi:carboxyl-terminal processing protease